MRKWLTAGAFLLITGFLKIWQHTSAPKTLEDYLAFRCGSAGEAHGDSFLTFFGHCWGCPVATAGAAMIIVSLMMALMSHGQPEQRPLLARTR